MMKKAIGSLDECGFSERLKPLYGYSPIGKPLILKTSGSWVHHSLLLAVFSDGRKAHMVKKGAIKRVDFVKFIDTLKLDAKTMLVMDNASIHKRMELQTTPDICYRPPYSPEFNPIGSETLASAGCRT